MKISCDCLKIAKAEGWNFILLISNNEVDPGLFNVESLFAPGYEYSYDTDEHLCRKQAVFGFISTAEIRWTFECVTNFTFT